jgi:endoglucanase
MRLIRLIRRVRTSTWVLIAVFLLALVAHVQFPPSSTKATPAVQHAVSPTAHPTTTRKPASPATPANSVSPTTTPHPTLTPRPSSVPPASPSPSSSPSSPTPSAAGSSSP